MNKVFLDSSYAIALSNSGDQYNKQAKMLAQKLEKENISEVLTADEHFKQAGFKILL